MTQQTATEWIDDPRTLCYVRTDGYAVSNDIVSEDRTEAARELFGVSDAELTGEQAQAVDREVFGFYDEEITAGNVDRYDEPATTNAVMEYRGPLKKG